MNPRSAHRLRAAGSLGREILGRNSAAGGRHAEAGTILAGTINAGSRTGLNAAELILARAAGLLPSGENSNE